MSVAVSRRLLILAEGYSADPHHGKTMRGIVDYGQDAVVAILDSERAGESHKGIPIVAEVAAALGFGPDTILVGVAPTSSPPAAATSSMVTTSARASAYRALASFSSSRRTIASTAAGTVTCGARSAMGGTGAIMCFDIIAIASPSKG